jgi:hypothetical protein
VSFLTMMPALLPPTPPTAVIPPGDSGALASTFDITDAKIGHSDFSKNYNENDYYSH